MSLATATHGAPRGPASAPARADSFGIRDLVREFGLTARTLRFYEEKGLLSPGRSGQERIYSRRDRARLQYVLMGRRVGFSLEEIQEMLDLSDLADRSTGHLRSALARFRDRIDRLEQQKADIDRALAEMSHASRMIETKLAARERDAGVASAR
jgi:DNA-binding transcriptional MerR regulator